MVLPVYIAQRFLFRVSEFFKHWYIDSFKLFTHSIISFLESLDRVLAVRVSLRYIFTPLFQDRSFIGYILGFLARSIRIFFGGIIYTGVIISAFLIYVFWAILPGLLILKSITG